MNQSLAELREASRLIEKATFDLADKVPSTLIAELIKAAADIERVIVEVSKSPSRVN